MTEVEVRFAYAVVLGRRLESVRLAARYSHSDVEAATSGAVSAGELFAIERGEACPSVPVLQALATTYGIRVDELLPRDHAVAPGMSDLGHGPGSGAISGSLAVFTDGATGLRVEAHRPDVRPDRWLAYLEGAHRSYRTAAVEAALAEVEQPSMFFVVVDCDDRVIGGIRCHGPLTSSFDAAVLRELAGHPQFDELHSLLDGLVAAGVVEIKGTWVDPACQRHGLGRTLGRCSTHAMRWFGARHAIGCADRRLVPFWYSSGWRTVERIGPFPYPDEHHQSVVLWLEGAELAERCAPEQLELIRNETEQLACYQPRPPTYPVVGSAWQAVILDEGDPGDRSVLAHLRSNNAIDVADALAQQQESLRSLRPPPAASVLAEAPRWVHYPWRRTVVRILGPAGFRLARFDRNRNKIDPEEQDRLGRLKVGVVGLSGGHTVAHVLALEGLCGELRLADLDTIELPNLNRLPVSVLDLALNKAVATARRIAEVDPYLPVAIFPEGLTTANVARFMDGLDVVVEECDSLDVKLLVREAARDRGIPVLMGTSDRGLFDVERFDLEPQRAPFHGLLGDIGLTDLAGLPTHDKVPYVLRILEPGQLSSRLAASMAEIDKTVTTWPQLAGDIMLGAATVAAAVRRLGTGAQLRSGRTRVDIDGVLDNPVSPEADILDLAAFPVPPPPTPPEDPFLAVAFAANLAPSGGNSQPWRLQLQGSRLRIELDRSRTSRMDVRFRGSFVAIGAATLNARAAAAALGVYGGFEFEPESETSDVAASIRFGECRDRELAVLYSAVLERATNRRPGRPTPVDNSTLDALRDQAAIDGARLHVLTDADLIADYAEILAESDRLRYLSPALHSELMSELRWPGRDCLETGIDVRTLELDTADVAKLAVARRRDVMDDLARWDGGRALGDVTRERVRSSSALAVVTVRGSSRGSYLRGGSALERVWLAAEAAQLAVQPVSPVFVFAVEPDDFAALVPRPYVRRLAALSARFRRLVGLDDDENVVLVLRLSHAAPPSVRSLRLGISGTPGANRRNLS
jgi:hypothetical protein